MRSRRKYATAVAVITLLSVTGCSAENPDIELKSELAAQLGELSDSFRTTMRTTAIADWKQTMQDSSGGVLGERWSGEESDVAALNAAAGRTVIYGIEQTGNRLTFDALISAEAHTGSGMLYTIHSAFTCVELTAQYEPGKVTVVEEDSSCASALERQFKGAERYGLRSLGG